MLRRIQYLAKEEALFKTHYVRHQVSPSHPLGAFANTLAHKMETDDVNLFIVHPRTSQGIQAEAYMKGCLQSGFPPRSIVLHASVIAELKARCIGAVMAHEVAHIALKHNPNYLLKTRDSRKVNQHLHHRNEYAADALAARTLNAYDCLYTMRLIQGAGANTTSSLTHPTMSQRCERIAEMIMREALPPRSAQDEKLVQLVLNEANAPSAHPCSRSRGRG